MEPYDVAIIGCGVVGAATAYALGRYDCKTLILESENDVALGATKANSAILHAGYDPQPGTLMARLNVEGVAMAKEICAALDVPRRECGSLVVAFAPTELPHLQTLYTRGLQNGVPGLKLLGGAQARALEPALSDKVLAALYAPTTAVTSPWEFALAMAEMAVVNGAVLHRRACVTALEKTADQIWLLHTIQGDFCARTVVNAAGLGAGAVHNMVAPPAFSIRPTRGQYHLLDNGEGNRVQHVIFQCPTAAGKGVLVTPTVQGNCLVSSSAEAGTGDTAAADDLANVAAAAQKSVPELDLRATIRSFAGVCAVADREDFVISFAAQGFLDLAGIQSPGLSAAPAIGRYAVELLRQTGLELTESAVFINHREKIRFKDLSPQAKSALIARDPAYGRLLCRCETVTEGEILASLHAPIPPLTVDSVKRRTNAGRGSCHGGFCGPKVEELLAKELGVAPQEILQEKAGGNLPYRPTKQPKGEA